MYILRYIVEMKNVSFSYARKKLKDTIDYVCENNAPVLITRGKKPAAVLMSLEDFESYDETAYLLKSPANRKHLMESLDQVKKGKYEEHNLMRA